MCYIGIRDVIEIMIPRPQVLRLAKRGIKVMTRSDWVKKGIKTVKTPNHTGGTSHSQIHVGIGFNRRRPPPDCKYHPRIGLIYILSSVLFEK